MLLIFPDSRSFHTCRILDIFMTHLTRGVTLTVLGGLALGRRTTDFGFHPDNLKIKRKVTYTEYPPREIEKLVGEGVLMELIQ